MDNFTTLIEGVYCDLERSRTRGEPMIAIPNDPDDKDPLGVEIISQEYWLELNDLELNEFPIVD